MRKSSRAFDDVSLSALIEEIYAAAEDSSRWEMVLRNLMPLIGSPAAALYLQDLRAKTADVGIGVGYDPCFLKSYESHYVAVNPWTVDVDRFHEGDLQLAEVMTDEHTLIRTEFYSDWLRPQKFLRAVNLCLRKEGSITANLTAMRYGGTGPFSAEQLRLLRLVIPHLQRSLRVHEQLSRHTAGLNAAAEVLDRLSSGVLLVNGAGMVTELNRRASEILESRDGLGLESGKLTAGDAQTKRALQRAIAQALRLASGESLGWTEIVPIARPSGKRSLVAVVIPVQTTQSLFETYRAAAAVFVADPELQCERPEELLMHLFGLTRAESRLAARLLNGATLEASSAELRITKNTARAHLKHIFQKTQTNRQAELVRLMMQTAGSVSLKRAEVSRATNS